MKPTAEPTPAQVVVVGAGFIGRSTAQALLRASVNVRLASRTPPPGLAHLTDPLCWERIEDLEPFLQGVDTVIHAVSTTVPATAERDPLGQVEQNVLGSVRLLEALSRAGVRRLIFLSSGGAMFSRPGAHDEEDTPSPVGLYGIGKLQTEQYVEWYGRERGLAYVILRPSNVYGVQPTPEEQGVIPHLMRSALTGEPFHMWGSGDGRKDYLHIDDVVAAITRVVLSADLTGLFNIASGERASVRELIRKVEFVSGRELRVVQTPPVRHDVVEVRLDSSRFRAVTGWSPSVTLDEGLERLWRHWQSQS